MTLLRLSTRGIRTGIFISLTATLVACGHLTTKAELKALPESSLRYPGASLVQDAGRDELGDTINSTATPASYTIVLSSPDQSTTILEWYAQRFKARGWASWTSLEIIGKKVTYSGEQEVGPHLFRKDHYLASLNFFPSYGEYWLSITAEIDECADDMDRFGKVAADCIRP